MENVLKNKKGITLISLVVTIVVLIILATISITLVLGDNGIFKQAQAAKDSTRGAAVQDEVQMWKAEKELGQYTETEVKSRQELIEELQTRGLLTEEEVEEINETNVVTIGKVTIDFGSEAKTLVEMFNEGLACTEENCTNEDHLHIGDYVNYQNPTYADPEDGIKTVLAEDSGMELAGTSVEDQTFDIRNNQLTWRVLGVDEETGGLKLIAGSPMKTERFSTVSDPYFYMYGAQPCVTDENGNMKAVNILNDICSIYKNDIAEKARSVNIEDVNEIVGLDSEDADQIKAKNLYAAFGSLQYGDPYSFTNHYTPESYLKGEGTTVAGNVDAYAYTINAPAEAVEQGIPTIEVTNTKKYNLLFNNVDWTGGEAQGACYWLASSGVRAYSSVAYFGPGVVGSDEGLTGASSGNFLFNSYDTRNGLCYGVRPVVVLQSGLTKGAIEKTDQTEEETPWSYTANPDAEAAS